MNDEPLPQQRSGNASMPNQRCLACSVLPGVADFGRHGESIDNIHNPEEPGKNPFPPHPGRRVCVLSLLCACRFLLLFCYFQNTPLKMAGCQDAGGFLVMMPLF